MANIKYPSDLPIMEEVTESTHAIVEDGGELKRISGSMLGGGIKTAIIKSSLYDAALAFAIDPNNNVPPNMEGVQTCECINMTHAEAVEILKAGEPLDIQVLYVNNDSPVNISKAWTVVYIGALAADEELKDAIGISGEMGDMIWTNSGCKISGTGA